ncbi:hypothetical protein CPZ23_01730 [Staphylococcus aureus]|nr:hypothetical protein B1R31_06285 [Staphylococcus aureus]OYP85333.1 hypothetical protein ATC21_09320 [Staphylococcus aureus]PGH64958.1 hypothetical protein CPZ23_01730 [Staphylococcus aureus]
MFINRKSNVSYLKCVAFFSFIRLNNSHISSKVTTIKGEEPFYIQNQKSGHMKSEKIPSVGFITEPICFI